MYDPFDPDRKYTVEEYFRLEELSDVKHEFRDGMVFPVGSPPQPTPIPNAVEVFTKSLQVLQSIMHLPGVMVSVADGPDEQGAVLFAKRTADGDFPAKTEHFDDPSVIVLLTSEFTYVPTYYKRFDRDRAIESVTEIVWIFADHVRAEIYTRVKQQEWTIDFIKTPDAIFRLSSIGVELPFAEVYRQKPGPAGRR